MSLRPLAATPRRIPAGQMLARELDARGWTQQEFADVLGRPTQFVSEIITGKKEVTRESAAQIGAALEQDPRVWLAYQDQYLLERHTSDSATRQALSDVRRRAQLQKFGPINLMVKRGILSGATIDELERQVMDLFEVPSIGDAPNIPVAARRSNTAEPVAAAQTAWVASVRQLAKAHRGLPPFSGAALTKLMAELPHRVATPSDFRDLPAVLAEVGVILVYIEAFPGAKIDGCSFILDGTPVIGISGRGRRMDKVLFTLLHEAAHILLGHVEADYIVEIIDVDDPDDGEVAANDHAGKWLLPNPLPDVPARISADWVRRMAAEYQLAPIVVVGQLQNRKLLEWRTALTKNAPTVKNELDAW